MLMRKFDHPPAEIVRDDNEHTAIRVGERLSILDLREGRLAKRELYNGIHDACEDWLSKADGAASKLPVFWIEGRSGTGKSAAHYIYSQIYIPIEILAQSFGWATAQN